MISRPELIAPAGNLDCARAAVANGADAVYFGLPRFNARMRADNFTAEQLPELVAFLHAHRVKAYAAFNILVFTDELSDAEQQLRELDAAGVDAVIIQDLGLAVLAQAIGLRAELHASTQMTITSPEGVAWAARLGIRRVILARETSLRELGRFDPAGPGLEVFVHGALCVAYSGQCLTSEALGQRSANRGECAQACRLPYQLIVDGALKDLGDRRYLLSPQDLAAVAEIPALLAAGIRGFKIEGRLKTPEYVAATTKVYRQAIDAALAGRSAPVSAADRYQLEMTFSRGLFTGWMHGVNHQQLVEGRFGKKRGPLVGRVCVVGPDFVEVTPVDGAPAELASLAVAPGDGVVFDSGEDPDHEEGGRVWQVETHRLRFERGKLDFARIHAGDRVWKTSDPQLTKVLRRTFQRPIPLPKTALDLTVTGGPGQLLTIVAAVANGTAAGSAARTWRVHSQMALEVAYRQPLSTRLLRDQLGRLGETRFVLGELHNRLAGQVILPVSELNRLRRELSTIITAEWATDEGASPVPARDETEGVASRVPTRAEGGTEILCAGTAHATPASPAGGWDRLRREMAAAPPPARPGPPVLIALCRSLDQISAALATGVDAVYVDFEDLRRYPEAVALVRGHGAGAGDQGRPTVWLATPRIQKAGEQGFFKLVEAAQPDGVLIRNLGGLEHFRGSTLRRIGDFSLNVANPLAARWLIAAGLEQVTIAYDLDAAQVAALLVAAPPAWFELTVHQHLPLFHMEHCVFAAFLSTGTDPTNCGRPCDQHQLRLRDRLGTDHPVKVDVGCRNTVYHARAQSGAEFVGGMLAAGLRRFRVELLDEDAARTTLILRSYRALLAGEAGDPGETLRRLNVVRQLGVTSGTLTVLG